MDDRHYLMAVSGSGNHPSANQGETDRRLGGGWGYRFGTSRPDMFGTQRAGSQNISWIEERLRNRNKLVATRSHKGWRSFGRSRSRKDARVQDDRRASPDMIEWATSQARLSLSPSHRQPSLLRVLLATCSSLILCLASDAILVSIGEAIFPRTKGYAHFHLSDYGKLTVIGVIIACVAWPIVTRVSWDPRWLFFRLAILVTLVLWLPDLYILYRGQPGDAVAVLMVMHLAIALLTYNLLVHVASVDVGKAQKPR